MEVEAAGWASVDKVARDTGFSGAVEVSRRGEPLWEGAWGLADRAHGIPNSVDTQFGTASGTKGFTALTVMSLVADGTLSRSAPVREILGDVLEGIDPSVTIEHLLAHTSGIGDYLDESVIEDFDDYVLSVPVHLLASTTGYLPLLREHPMKRVAGERFEYCNGGFVVLALVIEAVTGSGFHEMVAQRVFDPAGMTSTAFLRSDRLPGSAAIGYIERDDGWHANLFHLPIRGSGDGGCFTTVGDMSRFWVALFEGRILAPDLVAEMVSPHSEVPEEGLSYGLGFWLTQDEDSVLLSGADAGVSFRSAFRRHDEVSYTVACNASKGAWPVVRAIEEQLSRA